MGSSDLQHPTVDPTELADHASVGQKLNPDGRVKFIRTKNTLGQPEESWVALRTQKVVR